MARRASVEALAQFGRDLLQASGADEPSAEAATSAVIHASLHGIDSHGVRLLPWYADGLQAGLIKGAPNITTSRPRRAVAAVHADNGLGHMAMYRAMDEACSIARDCGMGMAAVVHSTHFGAAGAYALAAADAGFIGMVASNSGALVVPHGGALPIHGTNPLSFAAPNPGGDPFLLDMATSSIPWNEVLRHRTEGLVLPEGVAVDSTGNFVTDPHQAAALAPAGGTDFGYKGAALAGMAEVLSAVLTGMRLSMEQDRQQIADTELGQFVMAIDPTLFMPLEAFGARLRSYLDGFGREPGIMAAGGPEWAHRREREVLGVSLSDSLHAELKEAARKAGIKFSL